MIDHTVDFCRHLGAAPSPFEEAGSEEHYPPDLELEPVHLEMDLAVDLEQQSVAGTVTHTVRARHAGPSTLKLHAVDLADVAVQDSDGRPLHWNYDGHTLTATWVQPFAAGEERNLAVDYRVTRPTSGLYFSRPDDAYPDAAWYVVSDHETERARHWLPCVDLPNVRTTLAFHLRAAERFTILANGYWVDEVVHGDGTKTAHWRLDQRCPSYLICIAIGDFTRADDGVFQDGGREIPLAYFASREHSPEDLLRTFGRTGAMLAWMTRQLDMPFPYPKYYQVALPALRGAMENISLVSWTDRLVQDEELAREAQWFVDQVNVHEMAHSYFGDAIVCRDFAHAWLKESWATYMEQCWSEYAAGEDEALYVYYEHAARYFREADNRYKRPIVTRRFKSSWDLYDAHLYPGGACRLHTLRHELGDELFWIAVRDYLKRYKGQVVETDDFRRVLEEHSGRALGPFFDQWFHKPGYPDLKVTFVYDEKRQQGTFTIEQKQVDPEKGIPAFVLSTEVGWTIDGQEARFPVRLAQPRQVVTVPMAKKPAQVRFDPGCKALHKLEFNPGDPMLRCQLTEARDVIGRILAGHELARTGKLGNIQAIVDAYRHEPFWGVRIQFAEALGEAGHEAAVAGLADLIATETDPRVLPDLLRAAGRYRDARIREAVAARLANGLPPIATQVAYTVLGRQRAEAPWETLVAAMDRPTFNGIAQSGVFAGLAATRRDEAVALLLERVPYGAVNNRARPAAVTALADIGRGQEKTRWERIVEQLVNLLRDPWQPVAWAAARGLAHMKAGEAIPALEAFGRPLSIQERTAVERLVASLREADKLDGSPLKKQVEELQEKVRRLEHLVQKLSAQMNAEEG